MPGGCQITSCDPHLGLGAGAGAGAVWFALSTAMPVRGGARPLGRFLNPASSRSLRPAATRSLSRWGSSRRPSLLRLIIGPGRPLVRSHSSLELLLPFFIHVSDTWLTYRASLVVEWYIGMLYSIFTIHQIYCSFEPIMPQRIWLWQCPCPFSLPPTCSSVAVSC